MGHFSMDFPSRDRVQLRCAKFQHLLQLLGFSLAALLKENHHLLGPLKKTPVLG